MSCLISSGIDRGCKGSAGIYTIYLASRLSTLSVTKNTAGKVTDIDNDSTATTFYPFDLLQKTAYYKENRIVENGAIGFEKEIGGTIVGMSQDNKDVLQPIEQGESIAVIKTKAGKYFFIGEWEGLEIMPGEDGIGANITDLNGYLLALGCQEGERSNEIVAADIVVDGSTGNLTVTSS